MDYYISFTKQNKQGTIYNEIELLKIKILHSVLKIYDTVLDKFLRTENWKVTRKQFFKSFSSLLNHIVHENISKAIVIQFIKFQNSIFPLFSRYFFFVFFFSNYFNFIVFLVLLLCEFLCHFFPNIHILLHHRCIKFNIQMQIWIISLIFRGNIF